MPFSNPNAGLGVFPQQQLIPHRNSYQLGAALVLPFCSQALTRNKEPSQEKQKAASCHILDGPCSAVATEHCNRLAVRTSRCWRYR